MQGISFIKSSALTLSPPTYSCATLLHKHELLFVSCLKVMGVLSHHRSNIFIDPLLAPIGNVGDRISMLSFRKKRYGSFGQLMLAYDNDINCVLTK